MGHCYIKIVLIPQDSLVKDQQDGYWSVMVVVKIQDLAAPAAFMLIAVSILKICVVVVIMPYHISECYMGNPLLIIFHHLPLPALI